MVLLGYRTTSSPAISVVLPARVWQLSLLRNEADMLTREIDTSSSVIVSESKPSAFPSALRAKRSEVQTITDEMTKKATIRETCSKCGREEVTYYTLQTRGADEGETVFYNCECGHKYALRTKHLLGVCCSVLTDLQLVPKQLRSFESNLHQRRRHFNEEKLQLC